MWLDSFGYGGYVMAVNKESGFYRLLRAIINACF